MSYPAAMFATVEQAGVEPSREPENRLRMTIERREEWRRIGNFVGRHQKKLPSSPLRDAEVRGIEPSTARPCRARGGYLLLRTRRRRSGQYGHGCERNGASHGSN